MLYYIENSFFSVAKIHTFCQTFHIVTNLNEKKIVFFVQSQINKSPESEFFVFATCDRTTKRWRLLPCQKGLTCRWLVRANLPEITTVAPQKWTSKCCKSRTRSARCQRAVRSWAPGSIDVPGSFP